MAKIKDITDLLESIAPKAYQEEYDNSGLIVGDPSADVQGILFSLDCIEAIIDEAIAKNCNLIIAHHPIVFRGLKQFNGKNYVERTVIKAIKNDIAIYAIHTNLDNVHNGVNKKISDKLGLLNTRILVPKKSLLNKLEVFIPKDDTDKVIEAMHRSGAGHVGNYSHCSFRVNGIGSFKPNDSANPTIGESEKQEYVEENKVEVIFPGHIKGQVINAMKNAHPYEEVAYYLTEIENTNQEVGSGMIGTLQQEMDEQEFLKHLKESMELDSIKFTPLAKGKIKKIAVCGGAGSFLLNAAKGAGADAFITSDFKYHEFFDAEEKIMIADIGHYESEVFTKELLSEFIRENFANIATYLSEVNTNPVKYF